ncbi:hypothetical protein RFZ55_01805, partial [Acinetobacter baumannii]|nr:hypothetical protein [Acinetobacter baumannii]
DIFTVLFYTITPVIISTAVYQSTKILDAGIFSNIMDVQGMAKEKYETLWGMYMHRQTDVFFPAIIMGIIFLKCRFLYINICFLI